MKKVFDQKKRARLIWQDPSKMTTGVGYLRGQPEFEGSLEVSVFTVFETRRRCG